jgi:hypothetical protein
MADESMDLINTLAFAVSVITTSTGEHRLRIAEVYAQAQKFIATIPPENGSIRPRIVACFAHFDAYRAKEDVAGTGWLLTAIQERIAEQDLPEWHELKDIAESAARLLPQPCNRLH